jgi:speckle-type POZ protein
MSAKNFLDLLTLTNYHPAEHLKKFAIEYFRSYPSKFMLKSFYLKNNVLELIVGLIVCLDEVVGTHNWKKLKEENPALLCNLQQMFLTAPTD